MTTIACKNGHMACDSAWTDGNDLVGTLKNKITVLPSGALLGEAGDNDSRAVAKVLAKVACFEDMPTALELAACALDYAGLLLFPDGTMAAMQISKEGQGYSAQAWPVNRGQSAVGSGAAVAMGAMGAGATAEEAVAVAIQWDRNSKGPVHDLTCQPRPSTKSRSSKRTKRK